MISLVEKLGVFPKKVSSTKGGEWASTCPKCGGSDRFRIWPNVENPKCRGAYWCRQCNVHGDSIQFCMEFLSLPFDRAVRECGSFLPAKVFLPLDRVDSVVQHKELVSPCQEWMQRAEEVVDVAHKTLLRRPKELEKLALRGLPVEAVCRYRLGFLPMPVQDDSWRWGLEIGERTKFFLPPGYVIPWFDSTGVLKLKIRRSDYNKEFKFGKYFIVRGSMASFSTFGNFNLETMVIVESELDAMALVHSSPDLVFSSSAGSSLANPDMLTDYWAKNVLNLWICHDNDEAGLAMLAKWKRRYPHSRATPMPLGKDVGEAINTGLDVRKWVANGLNLP